MEDDFVLGKISPINKIEVTSFINGWAQIILFICLRGAYAIIGSKKQPKKIKDSVHLVVFSGRAIREMLDGVIHPQFPFKNVAEYSDEFTRSYLSAYLKKPERLKFVYLYFERFVRYIIPDPKRNGFSEKITYWLKSLEDVFSGHGSKDVLMDQLIVLRSQVAEQLRNAIASNRHQIITWQPHIDMDNESPPCLQRIWIRVYPNGDVDIHLDWRSRDAYAAYMVNLIGLIKMLYREVISPNGCTIVRVVDYCDSLHVYYADLDAAMKVKEVDLRKIVFNPQLMCREGYECVYA
jgi:thymidylate synthase